MRTGEWVVAENWRLCSTTSVVRGVAGELEDEKWRLGSTTLVRRVAGEWEDENWRAFPGAVHAASPLTSHRLAAGGGLGGRITHRHPHTPSTYTNTHTYADSFPRGHRLPQLTRLHTSHCTLTG